MATSYGAGNPGAAPPTDATGLVPGIPPVQGQASVPIDPTANPQQGNLGSLAPGPSGAAPTDAAIATIQPSQNAVAPNQPTQKMVQADSGFQYVPLASQMAQAPQTQPQDRYFMTPTPPAAGAGNVQADQSTPGQNQALGAQTSQQVITQTIGILQSNITQYAPQSTATPVYLVSSS